MVERRRRGGVVTLAPEAIAAGVRIAPSLYSAFKQWYDSSSPMSTNSSFPSTNGGRQRVNMSKQNKQRKRASKTGSGQFQNNLVPRPIRGEAADSTRMQLKDVAGVLNSSTAGVLNWTYQLGAATTLSYGTTLGTLMPRFYTMGGLYRQFIINKLVFKWVPNQPFTTGGTLALGVDSSPLAGLPGSFGAIVHHNPSLMLDIKAPGTITFIPSKKDARYTATSAGVDEDEVSYGQLQMYSSNTCLASSLIGLLWVELDVTFIGAT